MNYKKIVLAGIVFFFAVQNTHSIAYAKDDSISSYLDISPTPITYQLPYPGLLPDNPLYFLKVIRDDLTSFFLSKPLEKADFDLRQSDKNVEASYLLITQQGKVDLALTTFSEAQDYFQDAITQTVDAKKQGYSIQDISKRLQESNQKHLEMLRLIDQLVNQKYASNLENERNRADGFTKTIKTLR